jgi:hypothetical protein
VFVVFLTERREFRLTGVGLESKFGDDIKINIFSDTVLAEKERFLNNAACTYIGNYR